MVSQRRDDMWCSSGVAGRATCLQRHLWRFPAFGTTCWNEHHRLPGWRTCRVWRWRRQNPWAEDQWKSGGQSVGWIAEAWKWPLKRPRFCWSRTGNPFSTQGSFSENMRLSAKQASSTWGCSWIEGLASANTFDRNCQDHSMWSKLDSAHAQHWWTQGSKEKTGGERGVFEPLCSSSLGWGPTKPCYPEETVLRAERCCAWLTP